MRKKDPFIPGSEACLSTYSVEDSLMRCDVADPYWQSFATSFASFHNWLERDLLNVYEDRVYRLIGEWDSLTVPTFVGM